MTCGADLPLLASVAIRPASSCSFPFTVVPPINCKACERLESLASHSQASSRRTSKRLRKTGCRSCHREAVWPVCPWAGRQDAVEVAGQSGNRIEKHFGGQELRVGVGKIEIVLGVGVGFGPSCIRAYVRLVQNRTDRASSNHSRFSRTCGQSVEQLIVRSAGFESRKSSTGSTMPRPSRWNHTRLTRLFAKNGLFGACEPTRLRRRGDRRRILSNVGPPRALGFIT